VSEHDVLRLEVAMDDPPVSEVFQAFEKVSDNLALFLCRENSAALKLLN
jgi:hypothetical protein